MGLRGLDSWQFSSESWKSKCIIFDTMATKGLYERKPRKKKFVFWLQTVAHTHRSDLMLIGGKTLTMTFEA